MIKRYIPIITATSIILLVTSIILYITNVENRYYAGFVGALSNSDYEKMEDYLLAISNINTAKYLFLKGVKLFYEGDESSGVRYLLNSISNQKLLEKEIALAKLIVGNYLLMEKKDPSGIGLVTSPECNKYFQDYVAFIVGLYNFNNQNYDEALEFFSSLTNSGNEELKKESLLRISFILLSKGKDIDQSIIDKLSKFDINITNVLTE
ncbi:MAG: hypothetical protein N2712_07280 [Brevinematales bacterium]|nr:hypothetical protein [Brevinematales bacterium]